MAGKSAVGRKMQAFYKLPKKLQPETATSVEKAFRFLYPRENCRSLKMEEKWLRKVSFSGIEREEIRPITFRSLRTVKTYETSPKIAFWKHPKR